MIMQAGKRYKKERKGERYKDFGSALNGNSPQTGSTKSKTSYPTTELFFREEPTTQHT